MKNYKVLGEIFITEEIIKITTDAVDKSFDLHSSKVILKYNGYKGLITNRHPGYGDKNEIILANGEKKESYFFLLNDQAEVQQLADILQKWYQLDNNFKEYGIGGLSSYLLQTGLKYKDLQKMKKTGANKS